MSPVSVRRRPDASGARPKTGSTRLTVSTPWRSRSWNASTRATVVRAPQDMPWGYRSGTVSDPGSNLWTITAIAELLTHDEVVRRMTATSS